MVEYTCPFKNLSCNEKKRCNSNHQITRKPMNAFMFFGICVLWWKNPFSFKCKVMVVVCVAPRCSSNNAKTTTQVFPILDFLTNSESCNSATSLFLSLSPTKSILVQSVTWARNGKWIAGLQVLVLRVLKNPETISLEWQDVLQC